MSAEDRRALLKALAASLFAPLLPGCAGPPGGRRMAAHDDYAAALADLRAAIPEEMAAAKVPGLSIAVQVGRRMPWAEGFGYADREAGVRASATTRYRAGSITKVLTATAVMQLAEAGRLAIDAPLGQALPGFSIRSRTPDASPITLRRLMTHHAGLPSERIEGMCGGHPARFTTLLEALREEYCAFPPDCVYSYSNIGFALLGAAVERAGGRPYERFVRERLLAPLDMRDSEFSATPPAGTRGYDVDGRPGHEPALRDIPAGGLNTTAPDLLRFARLWFAGSRGGVLGPAAIAQMARAQNGGCALDADLRVGLGWHFAPGAVRGGGPVLFHGGSTPHFRAALMLLPEHQLAVAVLANSAGAGEVVEAFARRALTRLLEARSGITQPEGGAPPVVDDRYPPPSPQALAGFYVTELGFVEMRWSDEQLHLAAGGREVALAARVSGYLGLEPGLFEWLPADLERLTHYEFTGACIGGRDVLLARKASGFRLAGERVAPVPIPDAWLQRLGDYHYAGADTFVAGRVEAVRMTVEQGFLLVAAQGVDGAQRFALAPMGDDAAILRGLGRARGDTVHVRRVDGAEVLRYAGLDFRRAPSTGQGG